MRETIPTTAKPDHIEIWLMVYFVAKGPAYYIFGYRTQWYVQHQAVYAQSRKIRSGGLTTADSWTD